MSSYPIVLTGLSYRRCIVIGGGTVAARKVEALIQADAHPVVISPQLCPDLECHVASGRATAIPRAYQQGDLEGAALVIAATDDRALNEEIAYQCQQRGILINVVDCPDLCTFFAPSVIRRRDLLLAISTGGHSPAVARYMRETLEPIIDAAYGDLLTLLSELRPLIRRRVPRSRQRALWDRLLDGEIMGCLRTQGMEAARALANPIVASYCEPTGE